MITLFGIRLPSFPSTLALKEVLEFVLTEKERGFNLHEVSYSLWLLPIN
jgi:hypothetical protein